LVKSFEHGMMSTNILLCRNLEKIKGAIMMPSWHHNGTFDFYKKNYILESMIMAS